MSETKVDIRNASLALALAGFAGLLVARAGEVAVISGLVAVSLCMIVTWPRTRVSTHSPLLVAALLCYLVPLLMFGRSFAVIGRSPLFVADILIMSACLLMLPRISLVKVRHFAWLCVPIAVLAFHAVYVGYENEYPAAIKGLVLAVYPLVALITAAWLSQVSDLDRVFSILTRYVLPLVAVGLGIVIFLEEMYVPASYGLYLSVAGAFAAIPKTPGRRVLAISYAVGVVLLIAFTAERGPALAMILGPAAAWLAANRFRSRGAAAASVLGASILVAGTMFFLSLGAGSGSELPIAGKLVNRTIQNDTGEKAVAENNVTFRKSLWSYALETTLDSNPLLGVGAYQPINLTILGNDLRLDPHTSVHNSFIGYTFYAGFPAGLLVVAAFLLGLWRCWKYRYRSRYAPALFGSLVGVVLTAFTNVALETTYLGGPSWLVLGIAIGVTAALPGESTGSRPER